MRIVVALGGNALLRRGQPLTAENQRENIRGAAAMLAPLAREHEVVITHGNGPQVGLLALQSAAYSGSDSYPFDVLGAESQGMIGYMIEQEFDTILAGQPLTVTLLTQVEVDPQDSAFADPSKFVGPVYEQEEAELLARERGWVVKQDGTKWRRVVASPLPKRIFDINPHLSYWDMVCCVCSLRSPLKPASVPFVCFARCWCANSHFSRLCSQFDRRGSRSSTCC